MLKIITSVSKTLINLFVFIKRISFWILFATHNSVFSRCMASGRMIAFRSVEKRVVQNANINHRLSRYPPLLATSACHNVGNTVNRRQAPYHSRGSICAAVCSGQREFHRVASLRTRDKSWRLLRPSCHIGHRLWFSSSRWGRTHSPPCFYILTFRSDSFAPPLPIISKRLATRRARFCRFLNLCTAVFTELRLSFEGGTLHTFQDVDIVHGEADPFAAFATLIEVTASFRLPGRH